MGDMWLNEAQWRNHHTISHLSSRRRCCRPTHTHTDEHRRTHTQTEAGCDELEMRALVNINTALRIFAQQEPF